MTHLFSLLTNLSAGMMLGLIIGAAFILIALISCWSSKDRGIIGKFGWTIFIALTLAFGAMIYGVCNFRSMTAKIASIVVFGIVIASFIILPIFSLKEAAKEISTNKVLTNKSEARAMITTALANTATNVAAQGVLTKAGTKAQTIADPNKKQEIVADTATINQEMTSNQLTAEQATQYFRMVNYLIGIIDRGLPDADYKDWQGIYGNRKTLTSDYMDRFLVSRGFTTSAVPQASAASIAPAASIPQASNPNVQSATPASAPVLTSPVNGSAFTFIPGPVDAFNASLVDIRGTGTPGAGITIVDSGVTIINAGRAATRGDFVVDQNGNFKGMLNFKAGNHSLSAMQVINGQVSSASNPISFIVQAK